MNSYLQFKSSMALEKLYHNRGVSQDAYDFRLTDEKPRRASLSDFRLRVLLLKNTFQSERQRNHDIKRERTFSLKRTLSHLLYRIITLTIFTVYFAGNIIVRMVR